MNEQLIGEARLKFIEHFFYRTDNTVANVHGTELVVACRALQEENKRLKDDLDTQQKVKGAIFDNRESWRESHDLLSIELEQVKADRDKYHEEAMNERVLSDDIVAERERLYIELETKDKALHETLTAIGNAYEFGYLRETDENDVQRMIDRITSILSQYAEAEKK